MRYHLTLKSGNDKTGPIPVSITSRDSCPSACPLIGKGCYADGWPLVKHWQRVDSDGLTLDQFAAKIEALPAGQLWRHNQAGDLPGFANKIDRASLRMIAHASRNVRGFSYTHYPIADSPNNADAIMEAADLGFVVNLSANNLTHADRLLDSGIGPVVSVVPIDSQRLTRTPDGRRVFVCPATYRDGVTCASCQACALPHAKRRDTVIAFPAHGIRARKASSIAEGRI